MGFQKEQGRREGYRRAMDSIIETALPDKTVEALEERKERPMESFNSVIVRELGLEEEDDGQ